MNYRSKYKPPRRCSEAGGKRSALRVELRDAIDSHKKTNCVPTQLTLPFKAQLTTALKPKEMPPSDSCNQL